MLLEKYLNISINAGFLSVEGSIYKVTALGQEYLKHYKLFKERYIRAQKLLEALDKDRQILCEFLEQSKILRAVKPIVENWLF